MAGNIPTDYRVGDRVCAQDGPCGEVVATTKGGVELKLHNGEGISVPTENLDGTTIIGGEFYDKAVDPNNIWNKIIATPNSAIIRTLAARLADKDHIKSLVLNPHGDSFQYDDRQFHGEMIMRLPGLEKIEEALKIYIEKEAKPADRDRLMKSIEAAKKKKASDR